MLRINKVKPMFTSIVTTMEVYNQDIISNGLIDGNKRQGMLKEYQTVLAVGSSVRDIKEGDLVCINPSRFAVRKHEAGSLKNNVITDNPVVTYNFDVIEIGGKQCLLLQDRDINFIIEEYEEVPEVVTTSPLIKPEKKKLIV